MDFIGGGLKIKVFVKILNYFLEKIFFSIFQNNIGLNRLFIIWFLFSIVKLRQNDFLKLDFRFKL